MALQFVKHVKYMTLDEKIMSALYMHGNGLTCEQIEKFLKRLHQSVSSNLFYLNKRGLVYRTGEIRKTRSGRDAHVWKPTFKEVA